MCALATWPAGWSSASASAICRSTDSAPRTILLARGSRSWIATIGWRLPCRAETPPRNTGSASTIRWRSGCAPPAKASRPTAPRRCQRPHRRSDRLFLLWARDRVRWRARSRRYAASVRPLDPIDLRPAGEWPPRRPGPAAVPVACPRARGVGARHISPVEPVRRWGYAALRERAVGDPFSAEPRRTLAAARPRGHRGRARKTSPGRHWDRAVSPRAGRRRGGIDFGGDRLGVFGPHGHMARMAAHERACVAAISLLDDDALAANQPLGMVAWPSRCAGSAAVWGASRDYGARARGAGDFYACMADRRCRRPRAEVHPPRWSSAARGEGRRPARGLLERSRPPCV